MPEISGAESLVRTVGRRTMNAKSHKMSRLQFLWLRWLTRRCPCYIRLIAGRQADEVFRRVKEAEEDFREH